MWEKLATRTIRTFISVHDEDDAFSVLKDYAHECGAQMVSYHHVGPPFSSQAENFTLFSSGFPNDWVEYYEKEQLHNVDPIVNYAAYQTRPTLWSSVSQKIRLNPDQSKFMSDLNAWLAPGDGMAIPTFGPSGRHGYIGIGCQDAAISDWSPEYQMIIQSVCESFHLRFCEIRLAGQEQDFNLTDREVLILQNMANGLSDAMIGGTAGMRPNALRTAIHIIMKKMSVLDRPSAMLRARTLGIVS